jgi:YbbR domain-containing protein
MALTQDKSTNTSASVERWLRRIFVENWSLKLLALTITLALWFFVSAHQSEREVSVEPQILGKPAPTFAVKDVVVTPSKVRVQGRADRINGVEKVVLPISIEGRRESFDLRGVTLPISDPFVEPLGTVSVHVTILAVGNSTSKSSSSN